MKLQPPYSDAMAHFSRHDPIMAHLLDYGVRSMPPMPVPTPVSAADYFAELTSTIIGQQISTKAATAIRARVATLVPELTPEAVLRADREALHACGLSPQKLSYITNNAALWHTLPVARFETMDDAAVIAELVKLYGVGRWTAEMFCIFTLNRLDVFSFGDLGLMQALYHYYNLKPHYVRKIATTVTRWSPYRSVAALALWHARDTSFEA